jgi:hypothetical protein
LYFVVLFGIGAPALAQETAPTQSPNIEELVVPGRTPENLRVEIERLEVAVYERFNALNSNDEFDIHCLEQAPTGSNIPLRTCAPNFVIRTEARAASKILTDGRGGAGNNNNPAEQRLFMEQKSRELTAELQRVAREDEQLLRDLVRLDELKALQSNGGR